MAEVKLEGVGKQFGSMDVLPDLTLTVRDGELFTIVGPSGCGKSTLLHLIAGLEQPTAGRIVFDGQDVTGLAPRERDVALVFQNYALYPHMTVAENLAFPLRVARRKLGLTRVEIDQEVHRTANLLGIEALLERRPRELSGGQRQRVALGRALIRKPRVFLLDEPLSNLDAQLRAGMRAELRRLHDELGITMIYVTHDQTEAMTLADRLAVLDRGRLQQVGTPQELYEEPANLFVAVFIGYPPMNVLDARIEQAQIKTGLIRLPLWPSLSDRGEGKPVKLGIRPEQIRLTDVAASMDHLRGSAREMVGVVRLIEQTGSQIWVTVDVGGTEGMVTMVGLAEGGLTTKIGDRVRMTFLGENPHLFDPATGARLDLHGQTRQRAEGMP
ncbi:MAG: ABC transporter ATP-binding protein [Nitrospirae bacterium]|nr:ABC transporter ATP-binding protein [Nitrospirota bacterium]